MYQKSQSTPKTGYPWMIVYHGGENGIEYLSEKDHKFIMEDIANEKKICGLPDGRIINLFSGFQRIIPNPEYIDPVEDERKTHYYYMWNRYQELKQSGAFGDRYEKDPEFKFKKWYKENKKQLEEEYANKIH